MKEGMKERQTKTKFWLKITPFILSFTQQIFIQCLLCLKPHSGSWRENKVAEGGGVKE